MMQKTIRGKTTRASPGAPKWTSSHPNLNNIYNLAINSACWCSWVSGFSKTQARADRRQKGNAGNSPLTVSLLFTSQNHFGFKIPSKRNRKKVPTPSCPESEVIDKFKNCKRILGPKLWEKLLQYWLMLTPKGTSTP